MSDYLIPPLVDFDLPIELLLTEEDEDALDGEPLAEAVA